MIELPKQVFLCADRITRISIRSKELEFAFLARGKEGNLACIFQDDELSLWHGANKSFTLPGVVPTLRMSAVKCPSGL